MKFFKIGIVAYNFSSIHKIEYIDSTRVKVTFFNGEVEEVNLGNVNFPDFIEIVNEIKGLEFFK